MKEIKKVKKIPTANFLAFVYAVIGFIFGAFFYLFFTFSAIVENHVIGSLVSFILVNLMFAIILGLGVALVTGILGWALGFFFSLLYNFFTQNFSGIQVNLKDKN